MSAASKLDRYRFVSRIGAGGMATVALGEDTVLGRPVALKRLHTTEDLGALSRLKREALLGASVSDPNLVSVYDVFTSEEHDLVIVMEYVPGETLRQALDRQDRLPTAEALRILQGAAAGLDAIHRHGIVHRDVKPSNILLGSDGAVKVADLGVASVPEQTRITTAGSMVGSLSYMAPEQLEDGPSTPAIDVYALAAVAFEVLSGRKARREANPVALAHAISTRPPPDLREARPGAPPAAAELLIRGMAREPAARPRSAGELIARLRAALAPEDTAPVARAAIATETTQTRGQPPTVAPAPPAVQRRSRSGLIAGGMLALVAAAVALAVVLSTGGAGSATHAQVTRGHASHRARPASHATVKHSSGAAGAGSVTTASSTAPASRSTPTAPAASASISTTGSASATSSASTSTSTPAPAAPTAGAKAGAGPVSAVETFYQLAASHQYPQAWALADPTAQSQLGGYRSFQTGQAGDRSITFDSARTLTRSGAGATVAVTTTSVRDDGTHHCTGTVDLSGSPARWLLHMLHINCS
ncbi:MAG: serine/threonine-protein kinase [Solirubrobacteraceae bacterium]